MLTSRRIVKEEPKEELRYIEQEVTDIGVFLPYGFEFSNTLKPGDIEEEGVDNSGRDFVKFVIDGEETTIPVDKIILFKRRKRKALVTEKPYTPGTSAIVPA